MLVWAEALQSLKALIESPNADQVPWFFCPKVSPEISFPSQGLSSPPKPTAPATVSTQTAPLHKFPNLYLTGPSRQAGHPFLASESGKTLS